MKPKKNLKKKAVISNKDSYNDLFVCMSEPMLKRKYLLLSVKNSLIVQEEMDKIQQLRKEKSAILNQIKKNMESINSDYQELKKLLPNVKNVLSITEQELGNIESDIELLKSDIKNDEEKIRIEESMKESILSGEGINSHQKSSLKDEIKSHYDIEKRPIIPSKTTKNISKLDRIQNNLKVIESKLNQL